MKSLLILLSFFATATQASDLYVRFWEGDRNNYPADKDQPLESGYTEHLEYIQTVLVPGTLGAGHGALSAYIVYIPDQLSVSDQAAQQRIPFTEAAAVIYYDQNSYTKARNLHPAYGPLHMIPNKGFKSGVSYSSTPERFRLGSELSVSKTSPREQRVAYNLRPLSDDHEINWQTGGTIVWHRLRKAGIDDEKYIGALSQEAQAFVKAERTENGSSLDDLIDGHYLRVDENHTLQFIRLKNKSDFTKVADLLRKRSLKLGSAANMIEHALILAENKPVFAGIDDKEKVEVQDWYQWIQPGKSLNLDFVPSKHLVE